MASVEELLPQFREQAAVRGPDWLQDTLGPVLQEPAAGVVEEGRMGGRSPRSKPLERFSPDRFTAALLQSGGTISGPQAGPPAKRCAVSAGGVRCRPPGMVKGHRVNVQGG